jgi:hypothetical protein
LVCCKYVCFLVLVHGVLRVHISDAMRGTDRSGGTGCLSWFMHCRVACGSHSIVQVAVGFDRRVGGGLRVAVQDCVKDRVGKKVCL